MKTFTIQYADGGPVLYKAGQFVTFRFQHFGKELRRSYSVSSSPALNEPLSFTVKRIDNGIFSRMLVDKLQVGDMLECTGVGGFYTLPVQANHIKQVFFFAAGIGITPVFSLIKTLLHTQPDKQVVLVYSNREKEEVVFYEELELLKNKYRDNFKIEYLFSTAYNLARARLNKTLVRTLLDEYATSALSSMLFYMCGPYAYMRMVTMALEEAGIANEQIRKENFNPVALNHTHNEPPDKHSYNCTIVQGDVQTTIEVKYPETILTAAKRNGLSLPYSCEAGRCGSCAAICTSGKVWLSYNEVLMDVELKHGSILTCVGHPVGEDITIVV